MNEDFLKTGIKVLTAEKTAFNNILIVSASATTGLVIKAFSGNASLTEIIFIILGFIFVLFILKRIDYFTRKINFLLFELKKEKEL